MIAEAHGTAFLSTTGSISDERVSMGKQSVRQAARRAALGVQAARREKRAERERRLDQLAVELLVALGERDAAIAATEQRAGKALQEMTNTAGLSLREAVEWCGPTLTVREATRLRRLVADPADSPSDQILTP